MAKVLQVIDSFFIAEMGDKFELNEKTGMYTLIKNEEFYKIAGDASSDIKSSFFSSFTISKEYAKELIEEGILEEYVETTGKSASTFKNVFDEIDSLLAKYDGELANIDKDMKDDPQVVRLEKTTVLTNLIKVLKHLKDLKK